MEYQSLGHQKGSFGTATKLALREQLAKALVNKGVVLSMLGRSKAAIAVYNDVVRRFGPATERSCANTSRGHF
jgi:hypothetical protein